MVFVVCAPRMKKIEHVTASQTGITGDLLSRDTHGLLPYYMIQLCIILTII